MNGEKVSLVHLSLLEFVANLIGCEMLCHKISKSQTSDNFGIDKIELKLICSVMKYCFQKMNME